MDQPPAVAFTAFANVWPRATETDIGAALCATGEGKDFDFEYYRIIEVLTSQRLVIK